MRNGLIIVLILLANHLDAQLTYANLEVDYDSAIDYKNIRVIPIRYRGNGGNNSMASTVALKDAMRSGLVTVQERGTTAIENVHWLSLINNSDKNVYVASGEVLAGGRQDRMVSKDTIVLAKSGRIDLPVMCVEEGRWSERDKKFEYQKMANPRLRKTLDQSRSQVQVWKEINNQLDQEKIDSKTLAYLSRGKSKAFNELQREYWNFLSRRLIKPDSDIVGIICVSGNKILGSDIFVTPRMFYQQLEPLLQGYIEDATIAGSIPQVPTKDVSHYADQFLTDEISQEAFVKKNGKIFKSGGIVIHLTTY